MPSQAPGLGLGPIINHPGQVALKRRGVAYDVTRACPRCRSPGGGRDSAQAWGKVSPIPCTPRSLLHGRSSPCGRVQLRQGPHREWGQGQGGLTSGARRPSPPPGRTPTSPAPSGGESAAGRAPSTHFLLTFQAWLGLGAVGGVGPIFAGGQWGVTVP